MPNVIMLTHAQASSCKGPSEIDPNHVLDPVAVGDGSGDFFLGPEVLNDPAHAKHHDMLSACPQADYEKDVLPRIPPPAVEPPPEAAPPPTP
jgi:hypothetical protein